MKHENTEDGKKKRVNGIANIGPLYPWTVGHFKLIDRNGDSLKIVKKGGKPKPSTLFQ